jgi:hypothetical protein
MHFVETISPLVVRKWSKFVLESDGSYQTTEATFGCKMISHFEQLFLCKIYSSTLTIDSGGERVEFDFEEALLEQIESVQVEDQLFIFCLSNKGTIFRILIDWDCIGLQSVDRFDSTLFQYGISPIRFSCSDVESLLISLTNGQLYSVAIPLDGTAVTGIIELKDSSYVGQIRSIIATPVKFINAIRNNSKSRMSGLEEQALGMTSFHHDKVHLDFVFCRNGRLSVWNALSKACLKLVSLDSILAEYQFSDLSEVFTFSPSKVIEVYHSYQTGQFVVGQALLHLPFSYQPLFVSMEFRVDLVSMGMDIQFENFIKAKSDLGQLLDFLIVPDQQCDHARLERFTLWTLWESNETPIGVYNVDWSKDSSPSRWFLCQSPQPLVAPVIDANFGEPLDRVYLDFVFSPGVFPLETIARCAEYPSSNVIALPELYEYVLTFVSSRVSFNDQSMTLAEAWHRFVSQLVEFHNSQIESSALFHDIVSNRIVVVKSGDSVGYIRAADIIEFIFSATDLLSFSSESDLRGSLLCLRSSKLRNGISHLKSLTDYVANVMISTAFMEEVTIDMIFNAKDISVDDFAIQVFDRIKEHYSDNDADWSEHLRIVELLVSKVDSLDYILTGLMNSFQHSREQVTLDDPNVNETLSEYLSSSLRGIIEKRYDFIQQIFFSLVLIKHLQIPISFTRQNFVFWHGLYSCYVRLLWLSKQLFISRPRMDLGFERLSIVEESKKPISALEFLIRRYIHLELSSHDWAGQIIEACLGVLEQLGWATISSGDSMEENSAVIRWAYIFYSDIPPAIILELLEMLPCQSPSLAVLKGKVWLDLNEVEKAKYMLGKGASGIGNSDSDLGLVLPPHVLQQGVVGYYEQMMKYCLDKQVLELAIHFGKLAAHNVFHDPIRRIDLLKEVFNIALNYEDFDSAYEIMLLMQDTEHQKFCLGSLVGRLCDSGSLDLLCIRFKFAGMSSEVEAALLFKARTEIVNVSQSTAYHHICYTYFSYQYDFRTGINS